MTINENAVFIKMVLDAWYKALGTVDAFLHIISDEDMEVRVAPGRNTVKWIVFHLAVTSDSTLKILGGKPTRPDLLDYVSSSESASPVPLGISQVREYWASVSAEMNRQIEGFTDEEWFSKHNSVSAEDFEKEPHRNKLNVIINRTNHISHHTGQLVLVTPRIVSVNSN